MILLKMKSLIQITFIIVLVSCGEAVVAVQVHLPFLMDLVLRVLPKAQAVLQLLQHLLQQLQQQAQ